jgi:hypothetical protein
LGGISCGLSFYGASEDFAPWRPFITGTLHKAISMPFYRINHFNGLRDSRSWFDLKSGELQGVDFKKS